MRLGVTWGINDHNYHPPNQLSIGPQVACYYAGSAYVPGGVFSPCLRPPSFSWGPASPDLPKGASTHRLEGPATLVVDIVAGQTVEDMSTLPQIKLPTKPTLATQESSSDRELCLRSKPRFPSLSVIPKQNSATCLVNIAQESPDRETTGPSGEPPASMVPLSQARPGP
jgi:hypothetical protein